MCGTILTSRLMEICDILLTLHSGNLYTADSPQWQFVNSELEPEAGNEMFGRDPRDIHLGLALDGMNPYSEKRSTQSLTPVILFNYNLPPWLVTKKYFVMLTLLIPTKISLTGSNVDVFIQPLVD
jgi:hypothetical protein